MKVKFEASGTHIKGGLLKVRFDVYPEPGDACYDRYNVPSDPTDLSSPKVVTPCLCHFIRIDPDENVAQIRQKVRDTFDDKSLGLIDNIQAGKKAESIGKLMSKKKYEPRPATIVRYNIDNEVCDSEEARGRIGLTAVEANRLKGVMNSIKNVLANMEI